MPGADLGVGQGYRGHSFCLKFRIIFSRILSKIKSIYIAGKCPGHPFLNFLDPPLNASPLSSEEASLRCREAGEKKKKAREEWWDPRALSIFQLLLYLSGYPAGASPAEERDASFRIVKTSISGLMSSG